MDTLSREVQEKLEMLTSLAPMHREVGSRLFTASQGRIFPCDALVLAGLDRSCGLLHGFVTLVENQGYAAAAHLIRLQLDTALRLFGVTDTVDDPHEVAQMVIKGTPLRKIKDRAGLQLTDKRLVDLLTPQNPVLPAAYDFCSGFIHLSDMHFRNFLRKCSIDPSNGELLIKIGSGDDHISPRNKADACQTFANLTQAILSIGEQWSGIRNQFGTNEELIQKGYTPAGVT